MNIVQKILNNKLLVIIVSIAIIFLTITIIQYANSRKTDIQEFKEKHDQKKELRIEDFECDFSGKLVDGGIEQTIALKIKSSYEINDNEHVFTYDLKMNFVPVILDKKGTILLSEKKIIFDTEKVNEKEKEILKKFENAKFELSVINKIVIKGKRWELYEM